MRPINTVGKVISICAVLLFAMVACKKATPSASTSSQDAKLAVSPAESNQQRLEWNLKTLVKPYKQAGHTSFRWNAPATRALTEFARARAKAFAPDEPWPEIISNNAAAAIRAGCNDPMVDYLYVRFAMSPTNNAKSFLEAYCRVASNIQATPYPPLRKFYAALRAVDQVPYTYGYGTNNPAAQAANQEVMPLVGANLLPALDDKTMPAVEAFEACDAALTSMKGEGIPDYPTYVQAYNAVEKPMFENWPDAYTTLLLKGEAYVQLAWAARGPGFANTVTDEGWRLFKERLVVAENALTNAWQMNPTDSRIADNMVDVELGQGGGRDRMELWFNRAMALNPNDYQACSRKLLYLMPKWYGSANDMLEFGRECATNLQWGANVPLILLDAHYFIDTMWTNETDQADYWKRPGVWPDVQMAYERFFQANPNATGRYYQYAFYAYKCEQWHQFLELIPKLGPVDYNYFGGKDQFDKMVQTAEANINRAKSVEPGQPVPGQ